MLSTAEKKLLLVLSLSIFSGLIILINTSIVRSIANEQASRMLQYFSCESSGYVPGKCNYKANELDSMLWLSSIGFLILGIKPPLLNLLFVINFETVQKKIKNCLCGQSTSKFNQSNREHCLQTSL